MTPTVHSIRLLSSTVVSYCSIYRLRCRFNLTNLREFVTDYLSSGAFRYVYICGETIYASRKGHPTMTHCNSKASRKGSPCRRWDTDRRLPQLELPASAADV